MTRDFEQIREVAGCDGDSAPIGPQGLINRVDANLLLHAWMKERSHSTECVLVLEQVERFLSRALGDGTLTTTRARQARRLLRSIKIAETIGLAEER